MDYAHYMGCSFLGSAPALAIYFLLRAKRRASIPLLAWWLSLVLGFVIWFYGMSHSTTPSFAMPITAVGKAYDYVKRTTGSRHSMTIHGFRFVPEGEEAINIETTIILPGWGVPGYFDGRTFRVAYLKDSNRVLKNEAVEITILSGYHTGYHDSRDARPFGRWLGIPIGAALWGFGLLGLRYRRRDANSAVSNDGDSPRPPSA